MLAKVDILSDVAPDEFPFDWYAIARDDHFWFRSRIQAFKKFASKFEDFSQPKSVLEIGCGNGLVRRQLEVFSAWETDGADINHEALKLNVNLKGKTYLYNIHERKEELKDKYDVVILFDVLEHIPDTTEFLESCLYHLKPGGMLYINVPALNKYKSDYDEVVGHIRRYDKKMMAEEFKNLNAKVTGQRFWALSLVPALILRKMMVKRKKKDIGEVVEKGLNPPNKLVDGAFYSMLQLENTLFPNPFIGASLLTAVQKNEHGQ